MNRPRILIVEDEAIVARDLTNQLARLGYDPVADTPRGEEAIELVRSLHPELVLMDIHLAGQLDGIASATTIRERLATPVVFLTAFADDAILERSKLAEPFGYIVKPFSERELHSVVEIALQKHRMETSLRRSKEELAAILRTALDGFWMLDSAGRVLEVNDAACRMSGFSREELLQMQIADLEVDDSPEDNARKIEAIQQTGAGRFERRQRTKSGHLITVEISTTYDQRDGGRLYCFLRDITARKRAEIEQATITRLLQLANTPGTTRELLRGATALLAEFSGCESVGVRVQEGEACPYYETTTAGDSFVEKDRHLCRYDLDGTECLGPDGQPARHCLCDQLLRGEFDPAKPCFTARGSYWNNTVGDPQAVAVPVPPTHNHQRTGPIRSVALVPFRQGESTRGLLQFNNACRQLFTPEQIAFFEQLADHLALALAQRQSQEALRASEQRFRLLLLSTSDYTISTRQLANGQTQTRHGSGCLKVTGYSPAEFIHQPRLWLQMVHPADRDEVESFARRLTAGEQPPPIEHRIIHRDGSIHWVRNSTVVRTGEDGEVWQEGVIGDITERKQAEERLRASEAKFATIFRSAPLMIAITEIAQGTYLEVNDEFIRISGYSRDELIGHTSIELGLMPPEGRDRILEALRRDRRISAFPLSVTSKTRQRIDCIFSAEPVEIEGRNRLLSISLDMTENRRLETQLRQVQKMDAFGQLAGGVAHDFNNILAAITLHIGLIRQSSDLDPDTRASLQELEKEAARGASLTRQLLAFSRQRSIQMKPLDLNETVENLLKMLRRMLGERVLIDWSGAPDLPAVEGDVGMIEQVVMNLCVNARDAMPSGGRVMLRTQIALIGPSDVPHSPEARPGQFVRLSVTDTGCGIDGGTLPRIFEPFFTTKDVGQGTGLGLSIVHGIIKQHNGWIEVESAIGQGSTFHLLLPAGPTPATPAAPAGVATVPHGNGEIVLSVEDEESVRKVVAVTLGRHGYRVLSARNGAEAITLWDQHRKDIDLLLTDMVLPGGISGAGIIDRLRQDRPDLPVIMASGYTGIQEYATPVGVRLLPKPFDSETLLGTIRSVLAQA